MKLLLDMPVPRRTAVWLNAQGHDAVHAGALGLARATDAQILSYAGREARVVLTMDLDFPHLLRSLPTHGPGVILIRLRAPTAEAIQQRLDALLSAAPRIDLSRAIIVLEEHRIRLHRLPSP